MKTTESGLTVGELTIFIAALIIAISVWNISQKDNEPKDQAKIDIQRPLTMVKL